MYKVLTLEYKYDVLRKGVVVIVKPVLENWRMVQVSRAHHELAFELQVWTMSNTCRFPR